MIPGMPDGYAEIKERERKDLEENLLPELEARLDGYSVEDWSDEVEERLDDVDVPPFGEEYALPYEVLGAPGGPFAFFQYFLVEDGQDVEEGEYAAAIDQKIGWVTCNDLEVEEELQAFVDKWEGRDYLQEWYRQSEMGQQEMFPDRYTITLGFTPDARRAKQE